MSPQRALQESLGLPKLGVVPSSGSSSSIKVALKMDNEDSTAWLEIGDIDYFEGNPRKTRNSKYEDIKASIRADGITNTLTVTRPPGAVKYHPYGGGNTRLQIAKELYAEGDMRFARVFVVVKPWTTTAKVLIAHLSENSNRDDMTFWDAANGVADAKKNLEKDLGKKLATTELSKELQKAGVNFGINTLKVFAYAMENLEPLGPWLRFNQVRDQLQPTVTSITKLITLLGENSLSTQQIIPPILEQHANDLKALQAFNAEVDESDRKPVELDAEALIADLEAAVAEAIDEPPEKLPLMLAAMDGNSRLKAADLRAIQLPSKTNRAASPGTASARDATTTPQPQQAPLAGMLALAPTPAAAPVSSHSTAQSQRIEVSEAPTVQLRPLPKEIPPDSPIAPVLSKLLDINDVICLNDTILVSPQMPFGYLMDMPIDIKSVDGKPSPYPLLRAAAWKFLAALSAQLDPAWLLVLDPQRSTWAHSISQGGEFFVKQYLTVFNGTTDDAGNPNMGTRVQQFIKKDHCFIRNSLIGAPLQKVQLGVQGGFFDGQCGQDFAVFLVDGGQPGDGGGIIDFYLLMLNPAQLG